MTSSTTSYETAEAATRSWDDTVDRMAEITAASMSPARIGLRSFRDSTISVCSPSARWGSMTRPARPTSPAP